MRTCIPKTFDQSQPYTRIIPRYRDQLNRSTIEVYSLDYFAFEVFYITEEEYSRLQWPYL